jgi:hypothetical protein
LQDHFRQYVKPAFTDVYRDRGEAVGVAEFETADDMHYAIKKLDDTEFKNPFEKSYIRLVEVCAVLLWLGVVGQQHIFVGCIISNIYKWRAGLAAVCGLLGY